jgi:predicted nucleic acid-binding Zn ribbon protein
MEGTKMINCPKCGSPNDNNAKFCSHCYTRFVGKERQSTSQHSTKSLTLIVVLGFIVVALGLVYLVTGSGPLWRMLDRGIVHEYDRRLTEANTIFQEHDRLTKKAQDTATMKDSAVATSFAKEYSEKTGQWRQVLNDFKLFIETNDKRIKRIGINPDYVRDNIKNTLGTMKENEARFQKEADQANQLRMQQAKGAIEALKKLEARFLVGISYKDFSPALGETVHQVRAFLESLIAAERPELTASIAKVLSHYGMVKEVWDEQFSEHKSPYFLDKVLSLYPEVKQYKKTYTEEEKKAYAKINEYYNKYSAGSRPVYDLNKAWYEYADMRSVILTRASEELRRATSLLSQ